MKRRWAIYRNDKELISFERKEDALDVLSMLREAHPRVRIVSTSQLKNGSLAPSDYISTFKLIARS